MGAQGKTWTQGLHATVTVYVECVWVCSICQQKFWLLTSSFPLFVSPWSYIYTPPLPGSQQSIPDTWHTHAADLNKKMKTRLTPKHGCSHVCTESNRNTSLCCNTLIISWKPFDVTFISPAWHPSVVALYPGGLRLTERDVLLKSWRGHKFKAARTRHKNKWTARTNVSNRFHFSEVPFKMYNDHNQSSSGW